MNQKIKRYEELIAWQKARALTSQIYRVTEDGKFSKDYGLKDQIRRSAVSVMSNIAEGFERAAPSEFYRFLTIAKSSCAEFRSQLYVAMDAGYLIQETFEDLLGKSEELSRILSGLRASVQRKRDSQS